MMKKMFKITMLVWFLGQAYFVYSQSEVDSLVNLFDKETDVDSRISLSYEIAKLTYRTNPEQCKQIVFDAIKDSADITDKYLLGKNFNVLGIIYQYQSHIDSAEVFFRACLKIAKQINDKDLEYTIYNNLALNYRYLGQYEKAIEYYIIVLEEREKNNNHVIVAGVLNDIGNTYLYMRNYEMGIEYQKKALESISKLDTITTKAISIKANTLNSIGYTFDALDMNDSALFYYNQSLKFKLEANNMFSWCNTKNNICGLLRSTPLECIDCYLELLKVQNELNDRKGIVRTKMNLAVSYGDIGQNKKGLEEELDILNHYIDVCDHEMMARLFKNIAGSYSFLNDYENAYTYRKKYDQYQDSLSTEYFNNDILEITEKYQSEKKEKEIASQKLEIATKDLKISNRNKFLYSLGSGFVALLFLGMYVMQRTKRKVQQEKDKAIIKERDKGLIAVFNAQEEERKRVAKDLHDGIGQQLGATKLHFEAFSKKVVSVSKDLQDDITRIKKLITDTGTDVRNISHRMMPRALTELGLINALDDMLDISFSNSNITYNFEHYKMEKRLPQNIEIGLYRIAQELINNILKHSDAKTVDIQLMKKTTHCILFVQDDGKGIKSKESDGIGIQNMNSRLNALNGELNLESDSESGTTAIVKIAL